MKNCRLTFLFQLCFGLYALSCYGQDAAQTQTPDIRVEALKVRDLNRTAHRFRITVGQLVNARTALREATDLIAHQDSSTADYGTIGRLWVQLDRRQAREQIGSLLAPLCKQAEAAEDVATYRRYTGVGQQLIFTLAELDPEKASQLVDLWPAPPAKLGESGQQALIQFQNDAANRLAMIDNPSSQSYEQYLQPQKSASLPFMPRLNIASSLIGSNQKDKARALLDQAIADFGKAEPDPAKNADYENFVRSLAYTYPEKVLDVFQIYQGLLSRQNNPNPGMIYTLGDQQVLISQSESMAINMVRSLNSRPELALKVLDAAPGLKSKLAQLGGIDQFLNPSRLTSGPGLRSYPANMPAPPPPANSQQVEDRPEDAAATKTVDPSELLRTLRGKAEFNPEWVRRKLADMCTKKEHFSALITLAQMASYADPDLSSVALEVARSLLAAFDTTQQQANSLRTLISISRQVDGEVDSSLLRQGYNLVSDMRDEEKKREAAAGTTQGSASSHPSDDLEMYLIAQSASDDFNAALRRARSMEDENMRVRALLGIAQTLMSNF